jgi:DNA-directed RNA polymerase
MENAAPAFDGGYYLIREGLMRAGLNGHTAASPNAVSDTMLRAINIIQAVPWTVNGWVLDIMREAWLSGAKINSFPAADPEPMPARFSDEVWENFAKEEREAHKLSLASIHAANAKLVAKRDALLRKLDMAERLRDEPSIYFPHFLDFRGRIYPSPQDLNPQGDDIARSLIQFAEGKPLGPAGLSWLAVRLANAYGQDKLSFKERFAWVLDHEALIIDSAEDPLDGQRFWFGADEPFSFLATCREWAEAQRSGRPEEFVSHLPIPMDGTCNGLQHLSLMGRDPIGATATNCSAAPERHDLYSEVAEVVARMVSEDAVAGVAEAHEWVGRVDRKVVKRAVMTTPYGVTRRGIRDQLIKDGHLDGIDHKAVAARYMEEKISAALEQTVVSAKEIMAYFQDVAAALAARDLPLRWITPAGMEVTQSYFNLARREVETLSGRYIFWEEDDALGLDKRKQALASAPNIIHSFDAAMLALTVIAAHDRMGIQAFAFVHDSYGTHAADCPTLATILRNVAVDIYSRDQLAVFEEYVHAYAPGVELPARAPLGDFDVSEVRRAEYFFA